MPEVLIRPMEERDLPRVGEMERLCFATPWSEDAMEYEITQNNLARYLVLEEDGQVCAYAGTWLVFEEGHITNVAVHPAFRRRGYGSAVLRALMRLAAGEGIEFMDLEVRVSNEAAIALYKGLGFKKAGLRKGYYEDNGEDAIVMVNDRLEQALGSASAP
ncbi:MAG: ribosomal protein S18-alanine N-acetyltransferase [Christensenellaceae bacterium]|jgi:ribosomal-protein-alanine N-acetyltransferase|nr:ribosomal protein S18-alanine N-acetyltransferase [Christensenellaceae bacterium]